MAQQHLYNKGYRLLTGEQNTLNTQNGIKYIFQASSLGHCNAQYVFGRLYLDGQYVDENVTIGQQYLEKASANGSMAAKFELALLLANNGVVTGEDQYDQMFDEVTIAAKAGIKAARYWLARDYLRLSISYLYGDGVFPCKRKAKFWLEHSLAKQTITDVQLLEEHLAKFEDMPSRLLQIVEDFKLSLLCSDEMVDIANKYLCSPSSHIRNKSFALFKRAAKEDDEYGLLGMAQCYAEGIGCEKNEVEANRIYKLLVDEYDVKEAAFQFASRLENNLGHKHYPPHTALQYFCIGASHGCTDSALSAYEMIDINKEAIIDIDLSSLCVDITKYDALDLADRDFEYNFLRVFLLEEASRGGDPEVQFAFGNVIEELLGDDDSAAMQYKLAADSNHTEAAYCYARYLESEELFESAYEYFYRAALSDHPFSIEKVAVWLYCGIGCDEDEAQAEFWLLRSAINGDTHSMFLLGHCFLYQYNTCEHDEAAFLWIKQASRLGHLQAMFELGMCFQNGWGVAQNYASARRCYLNARSYNEQAVQEKLEELEKLVWEFYERQIA